MYFVVKNSNDKYLIEYDELKRINGFLMATKNKVFIIEDTKVKNISVVNKKLAHPLVINKVEKRYKKLLTLLADLLVSDDETGETFREALNQIERFRMEIKNKYRKFLMQKELEFMSKQLTELKKEANIRLLEVQNSYYFSRESGKGK